MNSKNIYMVFRMTNIANLSQSTDGNRLDFLKTCKERQEEQKYAFQSMVDDNKDLKQKLIELDRTLEEKIRQRDAKLEAAQLKIREFEENLKSLGELDGLNLKLTEAKEEVQKESNQKSIMALEIRMFGEKFGTITDFNSALGVYEGYFQTVNGPIPFKVHSPEEFQQKLKEAQKINKK